MEINIGHIYCLFTLGPGPSCNKRKERFPFSKEIIETFKFWYEEDKDLAITMYPEVWKIVWEYYEGMWKDTGYSLETWILARSWEYL